MQNRQNPQKHKGYSPWVLSCPVSCIQDVLETTKNKRRKTSKSTWISMLYCIRCSSHSPRLTKSSMLSKRPRAVCERVGQSHQRHHTHYMYTYTRLIWPTSKGRVRYSRPIRTHFPGIHPLARYSVDSAQTRCMTRSGIGATPFDSTDADGAGAGLRYSHNNQQGPA